MREQNVIWVSFFKRAFLAAAFVYLLLPIVEIFIPLNRFETDYGMVLYLIGTALTALLLRRWYFWLPVQALLLAFTYRFYFPSPENGWAWVRSLYGEIFQSLLQFWNGEVVIFPTNVALLLVLFLVGSSANLLITHLQPVFAVLISLGYLMILHVFTSYDFFPYVVRVLGAGILVLGLAQAPVERGWRRALLSVLAIGVGSFVFIRAALWSTDNLVPQQQWVESRARGFQRSLERRGFFDWVNFYSTGGGFRQMGYDEDDSELGGAIQQNFDPVLTSYDSDPHYWRISAKEVYTGRGWESRLSREDHLSLPLEEVFASMATEERVKTVPVDVADDFGYFPYTYQTVDISYDGDEQAGTAQDFQLLVPSMEWVWEGDGLGPSEYQLTVIDGPIDLTGLAEVTYTEEELSTLVPYLQLPDTLPARVMELAQTITAEEESTYGKVRAIESYLRNGSGLRYSLREAAILPEDRDYVDYFLFDSRVGYCDNFSTAMIVLSRALGIPTRWAKGFNMGTLQFDADGEGFYQVTNANAHSWPEVFFPGYGWIPFEPTPAFSQPLTSSLTSGPVSDVLVLEEENYDDLLEAEEAREAGPEEEAAASSAPVETTGGEPAQEDHSGSTVGWQLRLFLVAALAALAILFRGPLLRKMMELILKQGFLPPRQKAALIVSLFQTGRKKEPSETLRQYFTGIARDIPMHKDVLADFVQLHEKLLYASDDGVGISQAEMTPVFLNVLPAYRDMQLKKQASSF